MPTKFSTLLLKHTFESTKFSTFYAQSVHVDGDAEHARVVNGMRYKEAARRGFSAAEKPRGPPMSTDVAGNLLTSAELSFFALMYILVFGFRETR